MGKDESKNRRERRQACRYPLRLPVRYSLQRASGWGQIVNISSGGALLSVGHLAKPGEAIELQIIWPVLLNETVHLNLSAKGAVVRAGDGSAAVRFERCDFRTSSSAFLRQAFLPKGFDEAEANRS